MLEVLIALVPLGCGEAGGETTGAAESTGDVEPTSGGTPTSTGASSSAGSTSSESSTGAIDASTGDTTGNEVGSASTGEPSDPSTSTGEPIDPSTSTGETGDTGGAVAEPWLIRVAQGSAFDSANGVVRAPEGDVMIAGYVGGMPGEAYLFGDDDDPGRIEIPLLGNGAGFLSRHRGDGTIAWTEPITGEVYAGAFGLAPLADGAAVLGRFYGTAVFGAGQDEQTKLTNVGGIDTYLARYDFAGTLAWATQIGSSANVLGHGVAALGDGSIAVVGTFEGTTVFGSGPKAVTLTSHDLEDAFVARFAPDGELVWVREAGGDINDELLAVAATPDGGLVVTGQFQADLVFDRGGPTELTLISAGEFDAVTARFTVDGDRMWVAQAGGADEFPSFGDVGDKIAVLADGDVLVCGEFNGPHSVFGEGEPNETILGAPDDWPSRKLFLARYAAQSGKLQWVKASATGPVDGTSGWVVCQDILPRDDGGFFVTGSFYASATFGPGEANETGVVASGGFDLMLASYSAAGELEWARASGGSEDDWAHDMVALDTGVVIVGAARGTTQFDLSEDLQDSMTCPGLSDAYALRITP